VTIAKFSFHVLILWYSCCQRVFEIIWAFQPFGFERTRWRWFQKRVVFITVPKWFNYY